MRRLVEASASRRVLKLSEKRQGVVTRRADPDGDVFVLVTKRAPSTGPTEISEILLEVREQGKWVILGVLIILASAILAGRSTLRPLRQAMAQARDVAPGAPERRLSTESLPTELHPLIKDVNSAFDRLEDGFQAQRDFSSNVAHEVRTPLAVMRFGIEAIEDPMLRADLIKDLGQLDRIFVQLIDLARAETAAKTAPTDLDLHSIALDLARTASVQALRRGRTLAVTGAEIAPTRGHAGLLSKARR